MIVIAVGHVSWFERARTFVTVIDPENNKFLMSLLEDFFDSALVKLGLSDEYGSVVYLCKSSRAITLCYAGGGYLSCAYVYHIDYDLQVALSEALCRLMTKKWRDDLVHHWFEDNYLAEAFKEIKDREFETVKKPSDEKLEDFWIDFNIGSQSVTFYVDSNEGALWDSVRLSKDAVSSYSLKEDDGEKIVKIYMKIPAAFNKTEATKIKIIFSAEFEILSILKKVLGDEKMMINVSEEESIRAGKQANQDEAVIPESTDPQWVKDPSNSGNTEALSDKAFQQSQQLTGTVAALQQKQIKRFIVAAEGEAVVSLPPSAKKSKTPSPRTKAKPSEKPLEEQPMEESMPKIRIGKIDAKLNHYRFWGLRSNDLMQQILVKFLDAFGKLSREEESSKRKDSDQEMDDSVDNASFSKMLHEDFTDSGMVAAFENFIGQLKKSLWSRYKRMETTAQNALRASEKNVSTLLNQILESRLSKLETLQKIVAEELANLEKETQILTNMEKDAVVCTTSCVPAHKGEPFSSSWLNAASYGFIPHDLAKRDGCNQA
ncbi:Sycp2l [Columba guinea]|nr:Sycp2l [Columba guinea]